MAEKNYKKICSVRNATNSVKVWSGNDHFLFAVGNGYSEEYFRFFYSDIHSFKLSLVRFFMLWVSLSILLFFILLGLAFLDDLSIPFGIAAGIIFLFIIAFLWLGPKAQLSITTPTTNKKIFFGRKRKALKSLRKLCHQIHDVEGMVDRDELINRLAEAGKDFQV
jgi:branched-subunit amino acid transport protein AzlD